MAFDVAAARKEGYSDAEIADYLAKGRGYDIAGARKEGHSDGKIIAHLTSGAASEPAATGPAEIAAGAGEAALSTVTGATSGLIAGALGGANQIGKDLVGLATQGRAYQPEQSVGDAASQAAAGMTYAPRTETGQEIMGAVGDAAQAMAPMAGLSGPAAIIGASVRPSAAMLVASAKPAVAQATKALQEGATAATQLLKERGIIGGQVKPAAGTMGSAGAAATDMANQRIATAQALPQPIDLTKGQATRDFQQQRFEAETAKDPRLGQPLRERSMEQNRQLGANFEAMIDETGAQATNAIETGRAVDKALVQAAAARKNEYRTKYREAEKAGQMQEPVSLQPLADYLNANRAGRTSAPILDTIARELDVKGVGQGALADGSLVAGDATLSQTEAIRKAVNRFVKDNDPNDVRVGVEIKNVIDGITEGKGGEIYQEARKARQRYAQLFEDNAIVSNLLRTRRGTSDRQVALEDVFRKTILNGDRASLGRLRRTLQVAGGEQGSQAWKELQGATVRHLLDEATKGAGTDAAGVPMFSAAKLNNAVRAMDADGKLDFVLSKQGAQTVRDLNEISKVVLTTPPGTVNTSNTASVVLAAIAEAGLNGSITGLPIPVLTGLKVLSQQVKDAKVRKRVADALNEAKARQ